MLVWIGLVLGAFIILAWAGYRFVRWLIGAEVDATQSERDHLLEAEVLTRSKSPFL